jgi:deferrochelatase/peroxidase EfeB
MPVSGPQIDYSDVQGTILRGYRVDLARHFILELTDEVGARRLGSMIDGTSGMPQVTTAERWSAKPELFLNVGFTRAGLARLGLTDDQLATFDPAFQLGATAPATAERVGDVGASAPGNWIGGLADGDAVHVVLSLWITRDRSVLERATATLRAAFSGRVKELSAHDARGLSGDRIHFGYRDSIAQPTILGAPPRKHAIPDDQPVVPTGEFLLGYPNASGATIQVEPRELSMNGSYSAFRILEQDVAGFEAFLGEYAAKAGIDRELLAAKVCGRWRNGNPLELTPDEPEPLLPWSRLNEFQYVDADPGRDDTLGLKCPIGSHIRRNNPRDAAVVGTDSIHHRIVRRAMPYGPDYDPDHPDSRPRGLIGHFINASIAFQFEFLSGQWDNASIFVKAAPGNNPQCLGNAVFNISGDDIFLGINDPSKSSFTLAACGKGGKANTTISGFDRLITTKGGAYCCLPSISGLKYLARPPLPNG